MTFINSAAAFLSGYFDFRGRACRSEFWFGMICVIISWFATGLLLVVFRIHNPFVIVPLFLALIGTPFYSLQVRRLHDLNYSGWWAFAPVGVSLITLPLGITAFFQTLPLSVTHNPSTSTSNILFNLGGIIYSGLNILLLIWYCTAGNRGRNRFGEPRI